MKLTYKTYEEMCIANKVEDCLDAIGWYHLATKWYEFAESRGWFKHRPCNF